MTELNRLSIEKENNELKEIKSIIQNIEGEFIDQVFFTDPNHKLKTLAEKLFVKKLKEKNPPDGLRQLIFKNLKESYEKKTPLTLEESIQYDVLKNAKPEQIRFKINYETKKIEGSLTCFSKKGSVIPISFNNNIDLPSITNKEIEKQLDDSISANNARLPQTEEKETVVKKISQKANKEKETLESVVNNVNTLISSIWDQSGNPNLDDIKQAERMKLLEIKDTFMKKITDEESRNKNSEFN